MKDTAFTKEEESLSHGISPQSIELCSRVRQLSLALRDRTEATPYATDTRALANEVSDLCDYVEQLHGKVEALLTKSGASANSPSTADESAVTAEDKKAIEIQRETHELHPTVLDTVKALFMWRDSPKERLRDDK